MDNRGFKVYYDPQEDAVVMEWIGYFTSSQFRSGTEAMLQELIRHDCKKVLALIRDMVLISTDDQKWLEVSFLPKAIEQGFKAIALLTPFHYFNRVAIENITYKTDKNKLNISLFDTEEQAREWLRSLNV